MPSQEKDYQQNHLPALQIYLTWPISSRRQLVIFSSLKGFLHSWNFTFYQLFPSFTGSLSPQPMQNYKHWSTLGIYPHTPHLHGWSLPLAISPRVPGLKTAFSWSIYLFCIFSPYLSPELTQNGGFLNAFLGKIRSLVHFKLNTSQASNPSNKKIVNMVIISDLPWKPWGDYSDWYSNGEMI